MGGIELNKVVHKNLMVVNSQSKTKKEVLEELGSLLEEGGYVSDADEFIQDVYFRETEGITGIGQGVAIPHGKSEAVNKTTVAIAVLENDIEWETLDELPVNVVILFAVRDTDANTTHILLLQQVAIMLAHDDFIVKLKNVTSIDELYSLIVESN